MEGFINLKILFTTASAVTLISLLFYLQITALTKSKIIEKGILTIINRHTLKKNVVTDYITKAEAANSYPCTDIGKPNLVEKASKWQPVHDDLTAFVFSAYLIHESNKIVVISIRKQGEPKIYFCLYWYKRGNQFFVSFQKHVKIVGLPYTHGRM